MADPTILAVYRREITPGFYSEIRELYKTHSIAEDARDLRGLISTLTPDCVYELGPDRSALGRARGCSALLHGVS